MELENLLKLIDAVSESRVTDFQYEEKDTKLVLKKDQEKIVVTENMEKQVEKTTVESPKPKETTRAEKIVCSPLVGTFYAAPFEDAKPFVGVGDSVTKGQTLAIVEAMKLMNEIESEYDGVVEEIFVENGSAIEYGQPLFRIG